MLLKVTAVALQFLTKLILEEEGDPGASHDLKICYPYLVWKSRVGDDVDSVVLYNGGGASPSVGQVSGAGDGPVVTMLVPCCLRL